MPDWPETLNADLPFLRRIVRSLPVRAAISSAVLVRGALLAHSGAVAEGGGAAGGGGGGIRGRGGGGGGGAGGGGEEPPLLKHMIDSLFLTFQNCLVVPFVVLRKKIHNGSLPRPEPDHPVRVINPWALIGKHLVQYLDKCVWDWR